MNISSREAVYSLSTALTLNRINSEEEATLSRISRIGMVIPVVALLAACSNMTPTQQRALSGGAIGAGGGALLGWMVGAPALGAALGGAGGAAIGAVTTPDKDKH